MANRANTRLALTLAAVVPVMVGLSFAAVPFYSWFCRTTGYGGTTSVAKAAPGAVAESVTVVFDANVAPGMPWQFRPKQQSMTVRFGESALAFYEAYNPTDRVIAGQAAYNVAPDVVGRFFDKIACFCFNLQVLQPGERIEMPVTFFVDPAMLKDTDAGQLRSVTLSYTMFQVDVPEGDAASAPATQARVASGPATRETIDQ